MFVWLRGKDFSVKMSKICCRLSQKLFDRNLRRSRVPENVITFRVPSDPT